MSAIRMPGIQIVIVQFLVSKIKCDTKSQTSVKVFSLDDLKFSDLFPIQPQRDDVIMQ